MPADDGGTYLTPQVLTDVTHEMRVMRDESFGPVIGIMPVKDDDEAVKLMNDSPLRPDRERSFPATPMPRSHRADRIETGTVFMNRCDYLDPALCWTGCKDTGRGRGCRSWLSGLTRPKSYHLKKA